MPVSLVLWASPEPSDGPCCFAGNWPQHLTSHDQVNAYQFSSPDRGLGQMTNETCTLLKVLGTVFCSTGAFEGSFTYSLDTCNTILNRYIHNIWTLSSVPIMSTTSWENISTAGAGERSSRLGHGGGDEVPKEEGCGCNQRENQPHLSLCCLYKMKS